MLMGSKLCGSSAKPSAAKPATNLQAQPILHDPSKPVWEMQKANGGWVPFEADCQDFLENSFSAFRGGSGPQRLRVQTSSDAGAFLHLSVDFDTLTSKKVGRSKELRSIRRAGSAAHVAVHSPPTTQFVSFSVGGSILGPENQAMLLGLWRAEPREDAITLSDGRTIKGFRALEINRAQCDGQLLQLSLPIPRTGCIWMPEEMEVDSQPITSFGHTANASEIQELASAGDSQCQICFCAMEETEEVFRLNCTHAFHRPCLDTWFTNKQKCPACLKSFGTVCGAQPAHGTMRWHTESFQLPGHPLSKQSLTVEFIFPFGKNESGEDYTERKPMCYLPCDAEGLVLFELYKIAFKRRVMFGFGSRLKDGSLGATFNVHIKTSKHRGMEGHGYPDETYFERCLEEMRTNGVTLADIS